MEDNPMLNKMSTLLNKYFDEWKPERDNLSPLKPYLAEVRVKVVWLGLAIIAERLKRIAKQTLLLFRNREEEGDQFLVQEGINCLIKFWDIIDHFKDEGILYLKKALEGSDEDVISLASLCLASTEFLSKLDKNDINLFIKVHNTVIGTSCKMSLAYTIHMLNNPDYFKIYISPYFISAEVYREKSSSLILKGFDSQDTHEIIVSEIFLPGSSELLPGPFINVSLLDVIILDIASDGLAFQNKGYPWIRKQYN